MALNLSKDYTFAPNTTIASSEVNTNYDELYNAFSGLEATTSTLAKLKMDADPASAFEVATKQYVDVYATWHRPNLVYVSATTVDVDDNTGTANQTRIIFPDGNYRSVTEDTASAHKYRRFIITATAEFTAGTEDSGMRSGESEANNTWYAIYAVKSLIDTSKFVLVGSTVLPVQGSFSTLNTNFGTNGWVYLGMIRNGDDSGTAGDILAFSQHGAVTMFSNTAVAASGADTRGMQLASSASGTTVTWTYAAGTGSEQIPSHILLTCVQACTSSAGASREKTLEVNTNDIFRMEVPTGRWYVQAWVQLNDITVTSATTAVALDIFLHGYIDSVLGTGSNPLI